MASMNVLHSDLWVPKTVGEILCVHLPGQKVSGFYYSKFSEEFVNLERFKATAK